MFAVLTKSIYLYEKVKISHVEMSAKVAPYKFRNP